MKMIYLALQKCHFVSLNVTSATEHLKCKPIRACFVEIGQVADPASVLC